MHLRLTNQRLIASLFILAILISGIYLKLNHIRSNIDDDSKSSRERCYTELSSTKYQLDVVTEYKNRIDKLLTEMEKQHKTEKDEFKDIMENCVAMKQQYILCQSQFEDLQSECKKVKEDYNNLLLDRDKSKPK